MAVEAILPLDNMSRRELETLNKKGVATSGAEDGAGALYIAKANGRMERVVMEGRVLLRWYGRRFVEMQESAILGLLERKAT